MNGHRARTLSVALAVSLVVAAVGVGAVGAVGASAVESASTGETDATGTVGAAESTATDRPTEPAFVVELAADGDATVTLVSTYDLADADDEQAFEELRADPSAITDAFEDRLAGVAERTAAETDREMSVGTATAAVETVGDRGVVRITAPWSNLATAAESQVRLAEPFASGFEPDRTFVVRPPAGYTLTETSHEPADETASAATWAGGTSLTGFEATFAGDGAGSTLTETLPTPLTTLLALGVLTTLGYAGIHRRRR